MGGKDRAPICTWHVNLRDRDTRAETHDLHDSERETKTHDLHDSEGSVCECEQPYSDYRDEQISPAMAAQIEPYLPILYTETQRESVRGGAPLDPFDTIVAPHEPSHMVGGQG